MLKLRQEIRDLEQRIDVLTNQEAILPSGSFDYDYTHLLLVYYRALHLVKKAECDLTVCKMENFDQIVCI